MTINYELVINFAILFQIIFFTTTILWIKKFHHPGLYLLIGISLSFFLGKMDNLLQISELIYTYPNWAFIGLWFSLLLGPMIYFYVLIRIEPDFRFQKGMLIHLIWSLPALYYSYGMWWAYTPVEKIERMTSGAFENLISLVVFPVFAESILIGYLFLSVKKLNQYGVHLLNWFSNIEDRNLSAIRNLLTVFAVLSVLFLFWVFGKYFFLGQYTANFFIYAQLVYQLILVNGLFIEFMMQRPLRDDDFYTQNQMPKKNAKLQLTPSRVEQENLVNKLDELLELDKQFLNPNLTLRELARPLKIHARNLSELINHHYNFTFYELVNGYRIQFAKDLIKTNPLKSILEIAFESGFNSKSAFNASFKRFEGLTPTGYRKKFLK